MGLSTSKENDDSVCYTERCYLILRIDKKCIKKTSRIKIVHEPCENKIQLLIIAEKEEHRFNLARLEIKNGDERNAFINIKNSDKNYELVFENGAICRDFITSFEIYKLLASIMFIGENTVNETNADTNDTSNTDTNNGQLLPIDSAQRNDKFQEIFTALCQMQYFDVDLMQGIERGDGFMKIIYLKNSNLFYTIVLNGKECHLNAQVPEENLSLETVFEGNNMCSWDCIDCSESEMGQPLLLTASFFNQDGVGDHELTKKFKICMKAASWFNGLSLAKAIADQEKFAQKLRDRGAHVDRIQIQVRAVYETECDQIEANIENNDTVTDKISDGVLSEKDDKFLIELEGNSMDLLMREIIYENNNSNTPVTRTWPEFVALHNILENKADKNKVIKKVKSKVDNNPEQQQEPDLSLSNSNTFIARQETMEKCLNAWANNPYVRVNSLFYLFLTRKKFDVNYRNSESELNDCIARVNKLYKNMEDYERWKMFNRTLDGMALSEKFIKDCLFDRNQLFNDEREKKEILKNQDTVTKQILKCIWLHGEDEFQVMDILIFSKSKDYAQLLPLRLFHVRPEKKNDYFVDSDGRIYNDMDNFLKEFQLPSFDRQMANVIYPVFETEKVNDEKTHMIRYKNTRNAVSCDKYSTTIQKWLEESKTGKRLPKRLKSILVTLVAHRNMLINGIGIISFGSLFAPILTGFGFTLPFALVNCVIPSCVFANLSISLLQNTNYLYDTRQQYAIVGIERSMMDCFTDPGSRRAVLDITVTSLSLFTHIGLQKKALERLQNRAGACIMSGNVQNITPVMRYGFNSLHAAPTVLHSVSMFNSQVLTPLQQRQCPPILDSLQQICEDVIYQPICKQEMPTFNRCLVIVNNVIESVGFAMSVTTVYNGCKEFQSMDAFIREKLPEYIKQYSGGVESLLKGQTEFWTNGDNLLVLNDNAGELEIKYVENGSRILKKKGAEMAESDKTFAMSKLKQALKDHVEKHGEIEGQNQMIRIYLNTMYKMMETADEKIAISTMNELLKNFIDEYGTITGPVIRENFDPASVFGKQLFVLQPLPEQISQIAEPIEENYRAQGVTNYKNKLNNLQNERVIPGTYNADLNYTFEEERQFYVDSVKAAIVEERDTHEESLNKTHDDLFQNAAGNSNQQIYAHVTYTGLLHNYVTTVILDPTLFSNKRREEQVRLIQKWFISETINAYKERAPDRVPCLNGLESRLVRHNGHLLGNTEFIRILTEVSNNKNAAQIVFSEMKDLIQYDYNCDHYMEYKHPNFMGDKPRSNESYMCNYKSLELKRIKADGMTGYDYNRSTIENCGTRRAFETQDWYYYYRKPFSWWSTPCDNSFNEVHADFINKIYTINSYTERSKYVSPMDVAASHMRFAMAIGAGANPLAAFFALVAENVLINLRGAMDEEDFQKLSRGISLLTGAVNAAANGVPVRQLLFNVGVDIAAELKPDFYEVGEIMKGLNNAYHAQQKGATRLEFVQHVGQGLGNAVNLPIGEVLGIGTGIQTLKYGGGPGTLVSAFDAAAARGCDLPRGFITAAVNIATKMSTDIKNTRGVRDTQSVGIGQNKTIGNKPVLTSVPEAEEPTPRPRRKPVTQQHKTKPSRHNTESTPYDVPSSSRAANANDVPSSSRAANANDVPSSSRAANANDVPSSSRAANANDFQLTDAAIREILMQELHYVPKTSNSSQHNAQGSSYEPLSNIQGNSTTKSPSGGERLKIFELSGGTCNEIKSPDWLMKHYGCYEATSNGDQLFATTSEFGPYEHLLYSDGSTSDCFGPACVNTDRDGNVTQSLCYDGKKFYVCADGKKLFNPVDGINVKKALSNSGVKGLGKGLGKGMIVIGLATEANEIKHAYQNGDLGRVLVEKGASLTGSFVGGVAGGIACGITGPAQPYCAAVVAPVLSVYGGRLGEDVAKTFTRPKPKEERKQ